MALPRALLPDGTRVLGDDEHQRPALRPDAEHLGHFPFVPGLPELGGSVCGLASHSRSPPCSRRRRLGLATRRLRCRTGRPARPSIASLAQACCLFHGRRLGPLRSPSQLAAPVNIPEQWPDRPRSGRSPDEAAVLIHDEQREVALPQELRLDDFGEAGSPHRPGHGGTHVAGEPLHALLGPAFGSAGGEAGKEGADDEQAGGHDEHEAKGHPGAHGIESAELTDSHGRSPRSRHPGPCE
jgi:hypothetical protein